MFCIYVGVEYTPRSDMWTSLFFFISAVLLAESTQVFEPVYPPPFDTTITCMVPGPYENGKKRFVSPPNQVPIPEPILQLSLLPGQADGCWELPVIEVKEPYIPQDPTVMLNLNRRLDTFLDPTPQMRLITHNVAGALVVTDPNIVFNVTRPPYEIPEDILENFSPGEQTTIRQYGGAIELGQCEVNFQVKERPPYYYPRFQIQGSCSGMDCALPPTEDHDFSQSCRPEVGGEDQIFIRGLRWDCCHSYTIDQTWEYICGWRVVRFPIVHKCQCSCEPSEL